MQDEVVKLIMTGIVTGIFGVLGSTGYWSYKMKKLEIEINRENKGDKLHTIEDKQDQTLTKVSTLLNNHNKTDAVTMAVARDRIYFLCDKAITNRDFRPQTMRDITSLMEPYKANGGNGLADEFFERYEHLYKTHSSDYREVDNE